MHGRLRRESELRQAIERRELRAFYQPIVSLADGSVVGAEALVRWQHPTRGLLLPAEFLPLAEETGLIVPLGGWVLQDVCAQLVRWEASGADGLPARVTVNLSGHQLRDRKAVGLVRRLLSETGLDPNRLALEITETVLMAQSETAVLRDLQALGVRIVLDDFGTGYSSLSYLRRLPLDAVKLDQAFISGLTENPADPEIVAAVLSLARALDMAVIAEGVETEEQVNCLHALGCSLAQGYYFARPMPPEEMGSWLSGRASERRTAPYARPRLRSASSSRARPTTAAPSSPGLHTAQPTRGARSGSSSQSSAETSPDSARATVSSA